MKRSIQITKEQAITKLRECQRIGDEEEAHGDADGVLCDLLTSLGYEEVVAEWLKVRKWYG